MMGRYSSSNSESRSGRHGEYRGKIEKELIAIAAAIRNDRPHAFDEIEVQSIVDYAERVLTVPFKQIAIDGVRWLLPPVLILATVYLALFWKK